ncbi:MAG: hypothetical protein BAA01_02090 [Bacillus thermozeamaize]|uniref:isochorismate synthase n=1 Tax=Bacillus thermozeamaize TaxID=230954 RepID=A0A1Y3PFN1_9BACI|nr:MAG: hypothetical protein BAA01_02090 [Bacillus thermozeamaize]
MTGMTLSNVGVSASRQLGALLLRGRELARCKGEAVLVGGTVPVPEPVDPISLFGKGWVRNEKVFFWAKAGGRFGLVGLGQAAAMEEHGQDEGDEADRVVNADRCEKLFRSWQKWLSAGLREGPREPGLGPVLLGGFSFDPLKASSPLWRDFPGVCFVLPEYLYTWREDQGWLSVNRFVLPQDEETELMAWAEQGWRWVQEGDLRQPSGMHGGLADGAPAHGTAADMQDARADLQEWLQGRGLSVHERDPETWKRAVRQVAKEIRDGHLKKVVLARDLVLKAEQPFFPAVILEALRQRQGRDCYLFAVRRGASCFLGATPERLVEVERQEVRATCLAGSVARGKTPAEDERLGALLLADAKNRAEHAVVAEMLREALAPSCSALEVPAEPVLMKLRDIQHLYTPVTGRLRPGHHLLTLVKALHPTPAVGGYPREAALARIRELEQMDRGWYAAPVGWLDSEGNGEFAVAIRSALIREDEAVLFAGCGIMGNSDPQEEWEETRLKMFPMLYAIGSAGR